MLLLPDLDGSGMTSARTRPALAEIFELHALQLLPEHSGSFAELTEYVAVSECKHLLGDQFRARSSPGDLCRPSRSVLEAYT